ncbi:PspC domain-containing protein [Sphingomonas sp.]|uniref:PspC domain-containing protein n=1 Tax=Sphingomonas sp. TaxID=28214 RepID=UPI0025D21799|nr:PspC domain-containing protein [Sphingomonas sp.]
MARYSMNRRDKKLAGVCSTLGDVSNVDPTIIRIGFAAFALIVSIKFALIAYVGAGIWLHFQKHNATRIGQDRRSDFDRMADVGKVRPSVHAMRNDLDSTDRRLMAIDDHLAKPNDQLAREIEALREER